MKEMGASVTNFPAQTTKSTHGISTKSAVTSQLLPWLVDSC